MFLSKTYEVRDVNYYADWSKITSTWTKDTSVSGRIMYISPFVYSEPVDMEFKFKSLPVSTFVGLKQENMGAKFFLGRFNNQWRVDWNSNQSNNISSTITTDSVILIKSTAMNAQELYIDDTLITSKTTNNANNELRVDLFNNSLFELEYILIL